MVNPSLADLRSISDEVRLYSKRGGYELAIGGRLGSQRLHVKAR